MPPQKERKKGDTIEIRQNTEEARNYLFTGDVIMLQCQLKAGRFDEAGVSDGDCGFVRGDGLECEMSIVPLGGLQELHREGHDPRDFLFQVVDQLNYAAQTDLRRHKKHLNKAAHSAGSSQLAQLRLFERRAEEEARTNEAILSGKGHVVRFGDIIQLRHVRTKRFVDVRARMPARMQTTARRVRLQRGALSTWLQLNPLYRHQNQGDPVLLNDQVVFESVKLGDYWDLSYSKHTDVFGEQVYEVNCCKNGRGFYPVLYGRSVIDPSALPTSDGVALAFGAPLRMRVPHHCGFVSGSSDMNKKEAYMRIPSGIRGAETMKTRAGDHLAMLVDTTGTHAHHESAGDPCSKDVWVLELIALDFRECGISFNNTPVVLKHFASGRYLSVSAEELVQKAIMDETDFEENFESFAEIQRTQKLIETMGLGMQEFVHDDAVIATELSERLTNAAIFVLEQPEQHLSNHTDSNERLVPRKDATVMIRWNHPMKHHPLWLSVSDERKGNMSSKRLCWSPNRYTRDAVQLEVQDTAWMQACDVTREHCIALQRNVLPMMKRSKEQGTVPVDMEVAMLGKIDTALSDMIRFVADSLNWRPDKSSQTDSKLSDALNEPLVATTQRQRLVREFKFIDLSVELFDYMENSREEPNEVRATQSLDASAIAPTSASLKNIPRMRLRCTMLLVRTWMHCFVGHRKNKAYFHRKGCMGKLETLNGLGFGASEVYTTLVDGNSEMALRINRSDVKRYIDFIRAIGPEPTWLSFLSALCYQPHSDGGAIVIKQQIILSEIYMQGFRANEADRRSTMKNRKELLIQLRLGESIGAALGGAGGNIPGQNECLGRDLLLGGVRDVCLSWECPRDWQPGKKVLFHAPEVLGIPVLPSAGDGRKWVSMLHLVWVLEPEKCCEVATGIPFEEWKKQHQQAQTEQEHPGARARGKQLLSTSDHIAGTNDQTADMQKMFARYFLAQLHLVSGMARDCQMNSVMALQEEYSFTLCLSAAGDARLPSEIRAVFYDLLCDIWLCRSPHVELAVPSTLREYDPDGTRNQRPVADLPIYVNDKDLVPHHWTKDHLRALPQEVLLFYRIKTHDKMEALLQSLYKFLRGGFAIEQQIHELLHETLLMAAVIRTFRLLLQYGFQSSAKVLLEMTHILVRILDGRTDWTTLPPEHGVVAPESTEASAQGTVTPTTPLLAGANGAGGTNGHGMASNRFRAPPAEDSGRRWYDCDENLAVMRCKADIAGAVLHLWRTGQHVQMTSIIKSFEDMLGSSIDFKAALDGNYINKKEIISWFLNQKDNPTSLLGTDGAPGVVMCVDLLMYEDSALFELGLELLFTTCQRTTELLNKLGQVSFLNPEQLRLCENMEDEIRTLGTTLSSFECWGFDGNYATDDSQRSVSQVQRICAHIKNFCAMGDGRISPALAQAMLSQTDLFQQFNMWTMLDSNDVLPSNRPLLLQLTSLLCSAMASYVHNNPRNQAQVFVALPRLEHLLDEQTEACVLASEVFRGNLTMCQQTPVGLAEKIGELVVSFRRQGKFVPWHLSVFTAIVSVGVRAVPQAQLMVIDELNRYGPETILHLLKGDEGLTRLISLAEAFRSDQAAIHSMIMDAREADTEMLYYLRSLELLRGLATGREAQNLVNKPFVNSIFPTSAVLLLLTAPQFARHDAQVRNMRFSIHRHLKMQWLSLVHLLLYDVDQNMLDLVMLASPLHAKFLHTQLSWILSVLQPVEGQRRQPPSPLLPGADNVSVLTVEEDEFLRMMLVCVDSFCSGPYTEVLMKTRCPEVVQAMQRYATAFQEDLGSMTSRGACPALDPETASVLQMAAYRVVVATGNEPTNLAAPHAAYSLRTIGDNTVTEVTRDLTEDDEDGELITSAVNSERIISTRQTYLSGSPVAGFQAQWDHMLSIVKNDPKVQERIKAEEKEIGQVFARIEVLTDRDEQSMKQSSHDFDFRRAMIPIDAVLKKLITHASTHLHSSMQTLMRVLNTFIFLLMQARTGDPALGDPRLRATQMRIVNAGILSLINTVLSANLTDEVEAATWSVLYEVMRGDASMRVDKDLQLAIANALKSSDDTSMWESFAQRLQTVGLQVKRIRALQKLPALAPEEKEQINEYTRQLKCAVKAMEGVRLMVEGHYFEMQQYLFIQDGKERSICVPELAGTLLMRVCKDHVTADDVAKKDLQCLGYILSLLTELTQGPNMRNQEFLSTLGLIETILKLVSANFLRLQRQERDVYPRTVRRLKQSFMETLLALLEGRQDAKIHVTMLARIDKGVLRERLLFVYTYFIVGMSSTRKEGSRRQGTSVPMHSPDAHYLRPDTDYSEVYDELGKKHHEAEELLEDLDDQELDELLGEGLDILQLVLNLSHYSKEFEKEVIPREQPQFDCSLRNKVSEREFATNLAHHRRQSLYYQAWTFLHRFVKTIEVVLDGQLHSLHFQQPLTAIWYVHGAAKQRILDNIEYQSPDLKAKSFCQMCIEVHTESQLIRRLSRFSIFPRGKARQWAQRHLPDGLHRPFQIFLADDARLMQLMLRGSLVLGVALAITVGNTLGMKEVTFIDDNGSKHTYFQEHWTPPIAQYASTAMGALHCICTVIYLTLTACIKVPMQVDALLEKKLHPVRAAIRGVVNVLTESFFAWRLLLLATTLSALLLSNTAWMYCLVVLDFFCQSPLLLSVLFGIMAPGRTLLMTFLGSFIVTYVYAAIGFHFFRVEFGDYCSKTVALCAQNIMYQGTRSGIIGLSSMMTTVMPEDRSWWGRVVFDMSYFIVFGVMFLNTIVALIVDSFVSQRAEAEARESSLIRETFISCIDRKSIDSAAQQQGIPKGFQHNEEHLQNKWDYMSFIFYLREKSIDEYTGPEQSIRHLLENRDMRWMPLHRSKLLEASNNEGDASARDDILVRIERHTIYFMNAESRASTARQALFRGVQGLSKKIDEKMDAAQVSLEMFMEQPMLPVHSRSTMSHKRMTRKSVSARMNSSYGR